MCCDMGFTTGLDMGAFADPDSPDLQDSFTFPGISRANPWTFYDPLLALYHQRKLDEAFGFLSSRWTRRWRCRS
jgi:hypothetical protein